MANKKSVISESAMESINFYHLEQILANIDPSVNIMLHGPPGIGKCLGRGTLVMLPTGELVPVESLKAGDKLMGPDGESRTVLVTSRGQGPLYRITPVMGDPWVCNESHVLTLVDTDSGEIVDIPLNQWLEKSTWFKDRHKQFSVGINSFENQNGEKLPVDPYFLGLWFGDGSKSTKTLARHLEDGQRLANVAVTTADPEIKAACLSVATTWGLGLTPDTLKSGECPTYRLAKPGNQGKTNPLLDTMRNLVGEEVTIPEAYMRASREARLEFLAGYVDSDGELNSNCFVITQKREDWAKAVWWIARSLGMCATWTTRTSRDQHGTEGTYFVTIISGDTDQVPTRLSRKQATSRQQKKVATRTGITVEALGDGEFFGFTLSGDGRFLLNDFTVTHNSALILSLKCLEPCTQIGLATRQPEDISGCPYPEVAKGVTRFFPLDWFYKYAVTPQNPDPVGCIFFDEYDKGTPEKQVAVMRILSERELEGLKLGPKVRIIVAGNRRCDEAGAYHDMPRVVRNRLMHFEIVPSYQYWVEKYAYGSGKIHPLVTVYLDRNKGDFVNYDPKTSDYGFPTARSWTAASEALHAGDRGLDSDLVRRCIVGCIGRGLGNKFKAIIDYIDRVPKIEDLLSEKAPFPDQERIDEWIALLGSCISMVEGGLRDGEKTDYKPLQQVCKLLMMFPDHSTGKEFQLILTRSMNERPVTKDLFLDKSYHQTDGFNKLVGGLLKQHKKDKDDTGLS